MPGFYTFQREDGKCVDKIFPFGQCPKEIVDDDGVRAVRIFKPFNIAWKAGQETDAQLWALSDKRKKANIEAGERGRKMWKERKPKLVKQ